MLINRIIRRLKWEIRRRLPASWFEKPITAYPPRLHLGCGPLRAEGYCNVDITPQASVDITDDVSKLSKFPSNYAEAIYACHVLEHFSHKDAPIVIKNWFRVMKSGGEIRISVPDIDRIVKIYTKNWDHFQKDGHTPWIGLIYGGQLDQYDFHKTGFNFNWMRHLLMEAGFTDVAEYPHQPHFIPGFKDASLAHEPFGEFLSLNVVARKP